MGVADTFREKLTGTLESWTGMTIAPVREVGQLRESFGEMGFFLDEVEDMAATVMDYVGGRPHEVQSAHRRRLSQQSRIALIHDPLAGAEATLRGNFAFGKGISSPQANDPDVQKVIERAWKDPNNERKLTSYEAQRHRSNEMITSANLFPTLYIKNGRVRVGFRDADDVTDVVTDPEDDETPLFYVVRKRKVEWDYATGMYRPVLGYEVENGTEKVWYVEHWRNVKDLEEWAQETGEDKPERPPADHMLPGEVEHFRINRIGRSQFGVPPWARTMRYYTAMNALTEAQVQMRQGAASIIAQRVKKSGPRDILKSVSQTMNRAGQLGAASFRRHAEGGPPSATGDGTYPGPSEAAKPPPAGSWWEGFEHDRLEAVNLRSGAGEALADSQIVRAPISAASGFGQHYLGDPSNTNLATATTLELPTLMEISSWQETFEQVFRWFTDRVIEAAVQSGQLGGMIAESETFDLRPLCELNMQEDKAELEARTGKDLSYSFQMPYPGRRNLPDVTAAVASTLITLDPAGQNWKLREIMLDFLLRHGFETEDPAHDVEEIVKEGKRVQKEEEAREQKEQAERLEQFGSQPTIPPTGPESGGSEEGEGEEGSSQYGESRKRTPPPREMGGGPRTREALLEAVTVGGEEASRKLMAALVADARTTWTQALADPGLLTRGRPNGNGNGSSTPGTAGPL